MFTGIVEEVGIIKSITQGASSCQLTIGAKVVLQDVKTGDSINVNGICLTVTAFGPECFSADAMPETIRQTNFSALQPGSAVNLERALRLADRLGGHLMTGHVDGVGEVTRFEPAGESFLLVIRAPRDLAKYIARKGSITVNGVSLTVNRVDGEDFDINLIPHTIAVTNLKHFKPGSRVNLEVDLIARYIERLQHYGA